MLLLALDTSTRQAGLALTSEDELLGEYTWHVGNNHSTALLDRIQRILAEGDKTMQDLDGVAVAIGPGSFNGLRVAMSTAKALAFALSKPLVGVTTLELIAAGQWQWDGPICSLLEAGRSELYAACYQVDKASSRSGHITFRMLLRGEYVLLPPQRIAEYIQELASTWEAIPGQRSLPPLLMCGEISPSSRQTLFASLQEQCIFANGVQSARRASVLALLAFQRIQDGQLDDPLVLEPFYLRRPSITTSTRKQPLLSGGLQRADRPK